MCFLLLGLLFTLTSSLCPLSSCALCVLLFPSFFLRLFSIFFTISWITSSSSLLFSALLSSFSSSFFFFFFFLFFLFVLPFTPSSPLFVSSWFGFFWFTWFFFFASSSSSSSSSSSFGWVQVERKSSIPSPSPSRIVPDGPCFFFFLEAYDTMHVLSPCVFL